MLTDAGLRGVKPSDKAQKLSDGGGLYLHVARNGGKYWRYNYRFSGKQKTLALGVFPDVSRAKARERHKEAREKLADGIDPSVEKQSLAKTFESVARDWHAHWKTGRNRGYAHYAPGSDEMRLAERAIAAIPLTPPLYARVDLIRDDKGAPCLLELELTEPSLFFVHAAESADKLVAAVLRSHQRHGK